MPSLRFVKREQQSRFWPFTCQLLPYLRYGKPPFLWRRIRCVRRIQVCMARKGLIPAKMNTGVSILKEKYSSWKSYRKQQSFKVKRLKIWALFCTLTFFEEPSSFREWSGWTSSVCCSASSCRRGMEDHEKYTAETAVSGKTIELRLKKKGKWKFSKTHLRRLHLNFRNAWVKYHVRWGGAKPDNASLL